MAVFNSEHTGQQIDEAITRLQSEALKNAIETASNQPKIVDSHWWIWDVLAKAYVDTGVIAEGKTPVRGVDYWTSTDKQEIVNTTLNALPTWNGGRF